MPSGRSRTTEERGEAQRRIEREREIRRIVHDAFRSRFTGVVPVGDIVRERLTEQEIEQLVTGARPMTELLAMLGRQPIANEADGTGGRQCDGGAEGIAPRCA